MRTLIRLGIIAALLGLVIPFGIFASGQKESEAATGPVQIVYWTHEDPNRTALENEYVKAFQAKYPSVTVEKVTHPSDKIREVILTAYAANQGPDIFNIGIEDEYAYIANERVAPVDLRVVGFPSYAQLADYYTKGTLDAVTVAGKAYGLPLEVTNWCIFINKKMFRAVGLDPEKDYPKTWEDMVEVSSKIAVRDGQILTRRGFDFRYPYYLHFLVPMAEQLGGKLVSDDGKTAIVNDQAWIKVLAFMRDWGPSGKNLGAPTYTNARRTFNKDAGDVAMTLTGLYQALRIKAENPAFYDSGEWMVVPFPQFKDAVAYAPAKYYGHYYMVNAQSPAAEQKTSWQLVWDMLKNTDEYLLKVGLQQPTKALMSSPTLKSIPYSQVFFDDMAKASVVYYGENSAQMQDLLKEAVEGVMMSNIAPERALATLKTKAQALISQ